jgi:hypothetical protein
MSFSESQSTERMRRPADKKVVEELPVVPIEEKHCKKNKDGTLEKPTCPVCLVDYEIGDKAKFVPCGHIFHPECLDPWLKKNNTCPVCRHELPEDPNATGDDEPVPEQVYEEY